MHVFYRLEIFWWFRWFRRFRWFRDLVMPVPIEEYKYIGDKYVKSEIEDSCFAVFTFIRGDGNKRQYQERNFK